MQTLINLIGARWAGSEAVNDHTNERVKYMCKHQFLLLGTIQIFRFGLLYQISIPAKVYLGWDASLLQVHSGQSSLNFFYTISAVWLIPTSLSLSINPDTFLLH